MVIHSYQEKQEFHRSKLSLPKRKVKHKSRRPGTIRATRLPVGSGYRNHWQA